MLNLIRMIDFLTILYTLEGVGGGGVVPSCSSINMQSSIGSIFSSMTYNHKVNKTFLIPSLYITLTRFCKLYNHLLFNHNVLQTIGEHKEFFC